MFQSEKPPLPAGRHATRRLAARTLIVAALLPLHSCTRSKPEGHPPSGPDFTAIIERAAPAVVCIADGKRVIGTGFRVDLDGRILTAAHVAQAARSDLRVVWREQEFKARVISLDEQEDLALLHIDAKSEIPALVLESDEHPAPVGAWIVVLGNPFGAGTTATIGIVSSKPGAITTPAHLQRKIQINAAINPGNSGGPILNVRGEVIAVASAAVPGGFGLGFAVPASTLRTFLDANKTAH